MQTYQIGREKMLNTLNEKLLLERNKRVQTKGVKLMTKMTAHLYEIPQQIPERWSNINDTDNYLS